MSTQARHRREQPYEKPKLRVIDLAAEEVLGIGCKTSSGGVAFGATPCTANNCGQIAS